LFEEARLELIIGDRIWSTWSMRPWLVMKRSRLPFAEKLVRLRWETTSDDAAMAGSPTRLVPVLKDGETTVWDSLAICEYVAEKAPAARLWPVDPVARALGRSAAAEMHSGFSSLRGECPMDLSLSTRADLSEATAKDVRRIVQLWNDLLGRFGGPFLLGDWSIADAFFTPVATRFRSYGVALSDHGDTGAAGALAERLLQTPEFREWEAAALADRRE
jgi:glutathione S-transferase